MVVLREGERGIFGRGNTSHYLTKGVKPRDKIDQRGREKKYCKGGVSFYFSKQSGGERTE